MAVDIEKIREAMSAVRDMMHENRDYLIALDSAMGDGDLGITMAKGFDAVVEFLESYQGKDLGRALMQAGMTMNNVSPSTMGTLLATALMRAGKAVAGKEELAIADVVQMGQAAAAGIQERGKAKIGDKTILDSLVPAVNALKEKVDQGGSWSEAFESAYQAAQQGLEATKEMVSQHGRGHYYGEKSLGKEDGGAAVAMLLFKALRDYTKS